MTAKKIPKNSGMILSVPTSFDAQKGFLIFRDSRGLEKEAIKSAEEGNMIKSLELMNQAIKLTPQRASCFNNRAQIHRLNSDIHSALMDLNTTLQLTQGKGRSACQAFCQRGKCDSTVIRYFR